MTDSMTIPTAILEFSTTPSVKKLTPDDCDNDRQPETAIQTFWVPILQFLVVDRCRNHYWARRHRKSRIWRWNFDARVGAISIFPVVGRCYTYLPTLFSTYTWSYIPHISRWNFNCTSHSFRDISISGNRLGTLPASLPWSNALGSPLEFWWCSHSLGDISTSQKTVAGKRVNLLYDLKFSNAVCILYSWNFLKKSLKVCRVHANQYSDHQRSHQTCSRCTTQ